MADEERNAQDVTDLETTLASLSPRPSRVDRDRLLYLAGRASADQLPGPMVRRRWAWPAATAVSTVVAGVLAVVLAMQPEPRVIERIVHVPQPSETAVDQDRPAQKRTGDGVFSPPDTFRPVTDRRGPSYLRLRQIVLASGVDALPMPGFSGRRLTEPPAGYREVSDGLLKGEYPGESGPNERHPIVN